jgi:hypothetical protein
MERSRMTDLCYHIPTAAMLDVSGCVRASMRVTACDYACDDWTTRVCVHDRLVVQGRLRRDWSADVLSALEGWNMEIWRRCAVCACNV